LRGVNAYDKKRPPMKGEDTKGIGVGGAIK
jgi:hypothetical protein